MVLFVVKREGLAATVARLVISTRVHTCIARMRAAQRAPWMY